LSKGSGKATLPGEIQAYRLRDHDLVTLADEQAPSGGRPLLEPVWRGDRPISAPPPLDATRAYVRPPVPPLPAELRTLAPHPPARTLVASDALAALVRRLAREAA